MKNKYKIWIFVFLIGFCILYNFYDNNRFVVKRQNIYLDYLPKEFDGYQILQISDLHGKQFEKNQENLIQKINGLNCDCIVFTGDMNKFEDSDITSSKAVLDLIKGIQCETILWVDGNTGPFVLESINGCYTGQLTEIGKKIEDLGVTVLIEPYEVIINNQSIWFLPDFNQSNIEMNYLNETDINIFSYGRKVQIWINEFKTNQDIKIRIDHYPLQANITKEEWDTLGYVDYDLSISGHYHGGQIRLPWIGALYIPSVTSGIYNGYFPSQNEVKGLNQILNTQQYISTGLGSSASIPFLDFRLFNTPEINVLTLYSSK